MEKNNEEKVLKARSARSCIAAGYRLFTGQFRLIFRNVWIVALVYALISGVVTSMQVGEYPRLLLGVLSGNVLASEVFNTSLAFFLGQLLSLVVTVMLAAAGYSLLSNHRVKGTLPAAAKWYNIPRGAWLRTVVAAVVMLVIDILATVVIVAIGYGAGLALSSWMSVALTALAALVIVVLLLPVAHPITKYVTTPDSESVLTLLTKKYGTALRHWGLVFVVIFVTLLVTYLAILLTTLPAVVLTVANMQSAMGTLLGDPTGMPHYMGWLKTVVFIISGFIQAFVMLSALFPLYFMSLSIDAREKERQKNQNFVISNP